MKNSLKSLLFIALTIMVWSASVLNSTAAEKSMELTGVPFRRIVVTGNTRVIIIQSSSDWVTMDDDDISKVSVTQRGDELRINSTEKIPVIVTVHVKELFRIVALNTSGVTTLGKLEVKYLQVMMSDTAVARVKTNTESIYTVINGHASLALLGSTHKHVLSQSGTVKLDTSKFAALATTVDTTDTRLVMNAIRGHKNKL